MRKLFLISFLGLLVVSLFFNLGISTRIQAFAALIDEDPSQAPGYDPDTPTIPYEEPPQVPDVDIPPDIFDTTDIPPDIDTSDVPLDIPSVFEEPDIEDFIPPKIDFPAGALDAEGVPRTGCPTEGLVPCGTPGCPCTFCHLFVMFDRIVDFFLVPCSFNHGAPIVLLIATLMLAIGGFMYIFAYAGVAEGGPEMLSRAKTLFKSVIFGLLIIYGAWVIVNTFLWAIGATVWEGGGHWWEIECETTAPTPPSGPGIPSEPGEPSGPTPPSGPPSSVSVPSTGEITNVTDKLGDTYFTRDELYADVTFKNTSTETKSYRILLKAADGEMVSLSDQKEIGPGDTAVMTVSTASWNWHWDIGNLGGRYKVELYEVGKKDPVWSETRNTPRP